MALSARSRITSSSNSFQPSTLSSIRTSWTGERSRPRSRISSQILAVVGDAAAGSAQGEAGPQDHGIADAIGELEAVFDVEFTSCDCGSVEADLPHRVFEQQPVFGFLDGIDLRADQLHAVLIEHAGFGQRDGKIQAGLAADGGEQRVGALAADHFFGDTRRSAARRRCGRPDSGSVMMVAGLELIRTTS